MPAVFIRGKCALFVALIAATTIGATRTVRAEEFRIESKVFSGKEEAPTSESLTLFDDARAFDFLSSPHEITVFDISRGRIVLLDPERKLRTELTTDKVLGFADQLRIRAARQTDPLLKFAAEPKFEETTEDHGWLKFASPLITYRVRATKAENPSIARQYREFSDWSARLNVMLHPGSLPPFPRLAINGALDRSDPTHPSAAHIPEEVQVTIGAQSRLGPKPTALRSEHILTPRLLASDRKKIDEAGEDLVNFRQVPLEEYLKPIEQAKR